MANGKEVAPYNERALSLKQYLGNEGIKAQIMAAAPKMLNGERFLKVFYGACLRNPKLLECTTESVLQAAMFFAQLGLEPILGRAYLVPYLNSKNIDNRWVKQYEVQPQVGYQGLVDLARRSNTIADVWGACVYEADIFDLSYGMDRNLVHKPWYMDPEKRKQGQPGEMIGAYVVWQLKDGTKHPEYMPWHEIAKRRAKSQSYTWAETGDPKKGGGERDSVWHTWTEDMALKTVIKHSAKLVPASIEFMQAVEFDDNADNGRSGQFAGMVFDDTPRLPAPAAEPVDTAFSPTFTETAQKMSPVWPNPDFDKFVSATATGNNMSVEIFKAKVMAEGKFADLWAAFIRAQGASPAPKQEPAGGSEPPAWERSKWINLRGAGYADYITANLDSFRSAPSKITLEAKGKWINIYKGEKPWPLDAPQAPPVTQPAPAPVEDAAPPPAAVENPEKSELVALQNELRELAKVEGGVYLLQAQKNCNFAVGISNLPSTVDGCNYLIEQVGMLLAKTPPRP
jgi:recombination protein RecT